MEERERHGRLLVVKAAKRQAVSFAKRLHAVGPYLYHLSNSSPSLLLPTTALSGEKTPAYIPRRKMTKRDGRGTDLITSPLTNTSPLTDTSWPTDTSSLITARATCAGTCAMSGGREERVAAVWSGPWRAT